MSPPSASQGLRSSPKEGGSLSGQSSLGPSREAYQLAECRSNGFMEMKAYTEAECGARRRRGLSPTGLLIPLRMKASVTLLGESRTTQHSPGVAPAGTVDVFTKTPAAWTAVILDSLAKTQLWLGY